MSPQDDTEDGSSMGADLDAYRRHRRAAPSPTSALSAHLAAMRGSDQPQVVFARLADLAAAVLCDTCEVEIDDGSGLRFHVRTDEDTRPVGHETGAEGREVGGELHLAVSGPARERHPRYAGIVTFAWSTRRPTPAEELAVTIAVRHAEVLVDHERLSDLLAGAEGRAADAAVSAITSRSISVATGIGMHQFGVSEEVAEDLLRRGAVAADRTVYGAAARAVRRRALDDEPSGDRPAGAPRPLLRRVGLEGPGETDAP